jgi:hypothetical protein
MFSLPQLSVAAHEGEDAESGDDEHSGDRNFRERIRRFI